MWVPLMLLLLYLVLMFMMCRVLDVLFWCQQGISPTVIVDPIVLSVRQLKQLLEIRGVSYTGYVEKQELAHLVKASADVVHGEVEELPEVAGRGGVEGERERLATTMSPSHFSGSDHFYEQVEDTKDSVWLVQVVPASGRRNEPLLDDYNWRIVCNQVAPFAIRTGIFDCRLDRRLCSSKGWNEPLLLLAMPRGTKPKDKVVMRTSQATRPQAILDWMREELSIRVKKLSHMDELEQDWLHITNVTSSADKFRDVKILLLTNLLHPPLFLAALSIKFTGRVRFGMMTVKKEDSENVSKRVKFNVRTPVYLVITPECTTIYGQRRGEYFNFWSMNALLRVIQPEMNDVFLFSLVVVNMVATIQIFQVCIGLWWKRIACTLWTFVSYNLSLFSAWLLVIAMHRWPVFSFIADQFLVITRCFGLSDTGSLIRSDIMFLFKHPVIFAVTFVIFGILAKYYFHTSQAEEHEPEERTWWEALTFDCLFRPMAARALPMPPSDIQLEEGIELLIERLAVPNLWLQASVVMNDYIKDLPVWKFQVEGSSNNKDCREILTRLMDVESPPWAKYESSSEESVIESVDKCDCPVKGMIFTKECAVCLEPYRRGTLICGLPCGHNYHNRCITSWFQTDNHQCPICRWPVYKNNHPRTRLHSD